MEVPEIIGARFHFTFASSVHALGLTLAWATSGYSRSMDGIASALRTETAAGFVRIFYSPINSGGERRSRLPRRSFRISVTLRAGSFILITCPYTVVTNSLTLKNFVDRFPK